jgi:hypothetical protein
MACLKRLSILLLFSSLACAQYIPLYNPLYRDHPLCHEAMPWLDHNKFASPTAAWEAAANPSVYDKSSTYSGPSMAKCGAVGAN